MNCSFLSVILRPPEMRVSLFVCFLAYLMCLGVSYAFLSCVWYAIILEWIDVALFQISETDVIYFKLLIISTQTLFLVSARLTILLYELHQFSREKCNMKILMSTWLSYLR